MMIALLAGVPNDLDQLSYRWVHFVAGVLWIGLLYFFNWVNGAFVATLDADTKRKVIPELMPRALFWFRWGALVTWLSGVALLMVMYYTAKYGSYLFDGDSPLAGTKPELKQWIIPFALLLVGFAVYDILFKSLGSKGHALGVVIWGALAVGFAVLLRTRFDFSGRAAFIHVGALFGTSMAANVWMRIWPAQRRIITATKNGEKPDPKDPAMAGLRSKHNTYMSVPLLLLMVSVHQDSLTGAEPTWAWLAGILVIGFLGTFAIYKSVPKVKGF
jgi:uncharacterized membrane protein